MIECQLGTGMTIPGALTLSCEANSITAVALSLQTDSFQDPFLFLLATALPCPVQAAV